MSIGLDVFKLCRISSLLRLAAFQVNAKSLITALLSVRVGRLLLIVLVSVSVVLCLVKIYSSDVSRRFGNGQLFEAFGILYRDMFT